METAFKSTREALGKLPILPILSYGISSLFVGYVLDLISGLGGNAYIISGIVFPIFLGIIDKFSEKEIMKCFISDWIKLPVETHYLFVFNVILYHFLLNNYIEEIKNIWNQIMSQVNPKNLSK